MYQYRNGTASNCATAAIYPKAWRESTSAKTRFHPIKRALGWKILNRASDLDLETHTKGRHGGEIGHAALTVLRTLLWKIYNWKTGRLDPGLDYIAARSGLARRTVQSALKRLRDAGIIDWIRRVTFFKDDRGHTHIKQLTNAYSFPSLDRWRSQPRSEPPPPHPSTIGAPIAVPTGLEAAAASASKGNQLDMLTDLLTEPDDPLAAALAALGQHLLSK